MTSLFSENPGIERCLENALGEPHQGLFQAAVKENPTCPYLHI